MDQVQPNSPREQKKDKKEKKDKQEKDKEPKEKLRSEVSRSLPLDQLDYERSVKHKISRSGLDSIVIDEYAPSIFAQIREMSNVTQSCLINEWELEEQQLSKLDSAGKSGSYFLISKNKKFFLKSIEKQEKNAFLKMLTEYYQHLSKYPKSTFMRIHGFFRMNGPVRNTSFIMFSNCLLTESVSINEKYDLKGSTKDREASSEEKKKSVPNFLDNDFTAKGRKLHMSKIAKEEFMNQIKADSKVLSTYDIMDYSLLIGVHTINNEDPNKVNEKILSHISIDSSILNSPFATNVYQILSSDKTEVYFISIIDCLTPYDWRKVVAHNAKKTAWTSDELSTVNATFYQSRFVDFLESIIVASEGNNEITINTSNNNNKETI